MIREQVTVLLAGYDGTSRVPGTSLGAEALWHALRGAAPAGSQWSALRLDEQSKSSAVWCRRLQGCARTKTIRLALGGEHLITFPLLEVLAERHSGLRIVVMDAHHDAYDYPLLTHYSLFHYAVHELGIPTLIVGARHELDRMPAGCEVVSAADALDDLNGAVERARRFVTGSPFYFSVDLDVLDPGVFPAVSDAVPRGLDMAQLTDVARQMFRLGPVAADVVEYNPLRDPEGDALLRLHPFLSEVARWLA
jgi:arginase family enzyme